MSRAWLAALVFGLPLLLTVSHCLGYNRGWSDAESYARPELLAAWDPDALASKFMPDGGILCREVYRCGGVTSPSSPQRK